MIFAVLGLYDPAVNLTFGCKLGSFYHKSQNVLDLLTYLTGLVVVLVGMIIHIFVWQSQKGCRYGNQLNLEDGRRYPQELPLLLASAFKNELAYRKSTFKRLNGNIPATLCTMW